MRSEAIVVNASFYVFSSFAICIGSRTHSLYWQPAVMTDAKLNKKSVITLSITDFFLVVAQRSTFFRRVHAVSLMTCN